MRARTATSLIVLAASVAACGGGDDDRTALPEFCRGALARVDSFMASAREANPVPDDPRYGGTAVVATYGEIPDGMNGLVSGDYTATQHQNFVNLMTLVQYDEDLQPVPYLADSWEVDDPERPTAVTFRLRDDVYWHDGERTDAYDVAFTYLRATDPETGYSNPGFWDHYVGGSEGVEVLDSLTVRIRMSPHADYLDAWRTVTIMPEHLLGDVAAADLKQHPFGSECPVGNGPFVFESHVAQESWSFVANPAFPEGLGGRPYLDRYVYRIVLEQTTLLTELLTENVDLYIAPAPDQVPRIVAAPELELRHFPSRTYVFVAWNARRPQLADARVRRALTVGTNREEIIEALRGGYGTLTNSGVPPFHFAYMPSLADSLRYDPDRARRLLEEAGWVDRDGDGIRENADGVPLRFTIKYNPNQERQDIAEIMQAQLREVGVDARPQVVEYTTLISQITSGDDRDFDGVVMAWVNEFKVDDVDLFHSDRADGLFAFSGTRNPRIDRLLDTLQLVVDRDEARPLWHEYQQLILEEQPYTYFFFSERLDGLNRRMKDVVMDVRGEWINIHEWWIPAEERRGSTRASSP